MKINIKPDERVILVGKTGSGKTTVAWAFLLKVDRLIVIDTKFNLDPAKWNAEVIRELPKELPDKFRYILRTLDLEPIGAQLIAFRDYYLYLDELYAVLPGALKAAPAWRQLWTQGREFGIAIWAGVQRPTGIPLVTLTEADHYFVFRLSWADDRDRMMSVIGIAIPFLPRYAFIYSYPIDEIYIHFDRLELEPAPAGA